MFNLVVTCVGSKNYHGPSIRDAGTRLLRRGITNDVEALFAEWKKTLAGHISSHRSLPQADIVYKGAMWKASVEAFEEIPQPRQLWIISAGFGLINSHEQICGYRATFKTGEGDSLYSPDYFTGLSNLEVKRRWWNLLTKNPILRTDRPTSIHRLVESSTPDDVVLVVAGSDYYEAILDDLNSIDSTKPLPKIAIVGIRKLNGRHKPAIPDKLAPFVIPYKDGTKLQKHLKNKIGKCSRIQIHPRSAHLLIRQYNATGLLRSSFP